MIHAEPKTPGAGQTILRSLSRLVSGYLGLMLAAIVAVILVAGYLAVLKPKYETVVRDLERLNQERQLEVESMKSYLSGLREYRQAYEKVELSRKEALNELLPPSGGNERLFPELEQLIRSRGFEVTGISIETSKVKPTVKAKPTMSPYETVTLSLAVSGADYNGLKDLLRTIERHRHLMDVRSITWGEGGLSLKLDTYYLN